MSSIITSVKDLISSMVELVFSVIHGVFDTIFDIFSGVFNFLIGSVKMVLHTAGDTLKAAGGLGQFIASNIVVIALIAGGVFGYVKYQGRQGRTVKVGNKKLN